LVSALLFVRIDRYHALVMRGTKSLPYRWPSICLKG
jgi:hypothetical protein